MAISIKQNLSAQTEQGRFIINGDTELGFSLGSSEVEGSLSDNDNSSFDWRMFGGYFVIDNLALGLTFRLETSKTEQGATEAKESTFAVGPIARYYFDLPQEEFKLFGQMGLALGRTTQESGTREIDGSLRFFNVGGGLAYFINEYFSINAIASFDFGKQEFDVGLTETDVDIFNFGLSFGAAILLP